MLLDKREQERFSVNVQAKISYRHTKDTPEVVESVAANISASGVYLVTQEKFPPASKVLMEFYLHLSELKKLKFILSVETLKKLTSDQVWVQASGIVVRQDEKGIGVIFDTNYQLSSM